MIVQLVNDIDHEIQAVGRKVLNTTEIIGKTISIHKKDVKSIVHETEVLKTYFKNLSGEGDYFQNKYLFEKSEYKIIHMSLAHKIQELRYFTKEEPDTSRRVLFQHATECISQVHYMKRDGIHRFLVYIRSSDVRGLLPIDLFGLIYDVAMPIAKNDEWFMTVTIGSAHLYDNGYRDADIDRNIYKKLEAEV